MTQKQFRIWAMGCAHVGSDIREGRESLADPIRHSEQGGDDGGPAFDWDIGLNLGDFSGTEDYQDNAEGQEIVRQFGALKKHRREDIYTLAGNHDATHHHEPTQWWFRKWIDPTGENAKDSGVDPSKMPYPVEGTWERYSFRIGNMLFLMMSDRNDVEPPVGRGDWGGYPAGAVTGETFQWWQRMVEENQDCIVISAHHHMLKETTVASGLWEGHTKDANGNWTNYYHGYYADGGPEGSSYLYYVDDKPDAQAFEGYLAGHPGAIDLWLGCHTHTHPDDRFGGRSHIEQKWGANFINIAALTQHQGSWSKREERGMLPLCAMSRLLTFTEGSAEVKVQCYLHTSIYAPQGWYAPAERTIQLGKPFVSPV
jgi:hypothetical protein